MNVTLVFLSYYTTIQHFTAKHKSPNTSSPINAQRTPEVPPEFLLQNHPLDGDLLEILVECNTVGRGGGGGKLKGSVTFTHLTHIITI